jgi:hypothetical protein
MLPEAFSLLRGDTPPKVRSNRESLTDASAAFPRAALRGRRDRPVLSPANRRRNLQPDNRRGVAAQESTAMRLGGAFRGPGLTAGPPRKDFTLFRSVPSPAGPRLHSAPKNEDFAAPSPKNLPRRLNRFAGSGDSTYPKSTTLPGFEFASWQTWLIYQCSAH